VAILVLNLLIAIMNNSYSSILEKESSEWSRQRFRIIADQLSLPRDYPKHVTFLIREDHEMFKIAETKRKSALQSKLLEMAEKME
jgi:hypothetical protein